MSVATSLRSHLAAALDRSMGAEMEAGGGDERHHHYASYDTFGYNGMSSSPTTSPSADAYSTYLSATAITSAASPTTLATGQEHHQQPHLNFVDRGQTQQQQQQHEQQGTKTAEENHQETQPPPHLLHSGSNMPDLVPVTSRLNYRCGVGQGLGGPGPGDCGRSGQEFSNGDQTSHSREALTKSDSELGYVLQD